MKNKFNIDNYNNILQEDDCAPDGFEYFQDIFLKEIVGFSIKDFKENADIREDLGDTVIYYYGNYALANEIGIHSLYKKKS